MTQGSLHVLPMKVNAVAALLLHQGRVLSVSRKNDPNDLGLPGGKIDLEDANPYAAMVREVFEETGLRVLAAHMVFERMDGPLYVQTFRVTKWQGTITTREVGVVAWVPPAALLTPACRSFSRYNRDLFTTIGLEL
jgi:8-oxo-dGTP pyrophosphatase MutT (NUDIX family)